MGRYFKCPTWHDALDGLVGLICVSLTGLSIIWGASLIAVHYVDVLAVGRGPAIMSIIVGVFAMLFHLIGFWSCMKDIPQVLSICGLVCFLLAIGELIIGVYAFKYSDQLGDITIEQFQSKIKEVEDGKVPELKENMDNFQMDMKCCGAFNASDWLQIPDSCFADQKQRKDIYTEGCVHAIKIVLAPTMEQIAIFVTVLACIQVGRIIILDRIGSFYQQSEYEPV
ncbi:tetraspanin-11-like [Tetranychus urticae]|uniref:Tetraspanin n=1 Tax=Tetranychus urticae TaxID=32264 RepID=T1KS37_TETUR|nr:tetraspanin-11-like [Tetranychus urticae]XP_015789878.1 tetraspanin-11-like [Tetranychus urticae]